MFNINGEEWRVVLVPPLHPELKRQDKGYTLGTCDDILKTIYLNRELNDEYLWRVLSHEITHAAMFSYNVELTTDQEELLADLIATYGKEIISITNIMFNRIKEKRGKI